jgi:hypothetical protein
MPDEKNGTSKKARSRRIAANEAFQRMQMWQLIGGLQAARAWNIR